MHGDKYWFGVGVCMRERVGRVWGMYEGESGENMGMYKGESGERVGYV